MLGVGYLLTLFVNRGYTCCEKLPLPMSWRCTGGSRGTVPLILTPHQTGTVSSSRSPPPPQPRVTPRGNPRKYPLVGWARKSVWAFWTREKRLPLPGIEPRFVQSPHDTLYMQLFSFSFCYRWVRPILLLRCSSVKDPVVLASVWTVSAPSLPLRSTVEL
jgi:hypothetical protein